MAEVDVVMLGGKRVGKSTILAGVMETLGLQGSLSAHFICDDKTDYAAYSKFSIKEKYKALRNMLESHSSRTMFMTRGLGDSKIQKYNISLRLSNKPGHLMVDFYDVPGEFCNPKNVEFKSEMLPLIENSDVFIIAIDTPYLMECSTGVNNAHNRISDLEVALQNIIVKDSTDLKLVLLVPLKCERWVESGEIEKVIDKVKQAYSTLLNILSAYPSTSVSILPVSTIGGIKFKEMTEAKVVRRDGVLTRYSCHPISDNEVVLSNGSIYTIQPPYSVDTDPEAKIDGIKVPNAWYEVVSGKGFSPKNCEQVALHILRFLIGKTALKRQQDEAENQGFFGLLNRAIDSLKNWWNGVDYDAFKALISELQSQGKIKDSSDGIELYHICKEWKEVRI